MTNFLLCISVLTYKKNIALIIFKMSSQITLNKYDNAHINKVILVVDEEFFKSHG
jgi:hypothetical protein